jgi:integrase
LRGRETTRKVGLAEREEKARQARDLAYEGIDPIIHRKSERIKAAEEAARAVTFREAAETYITAFEDSWRNPKHRQQWRNSLDTYAYPVLGSMRVKDIRLEDILAVLQPIWKKKHETASRVRGRIETILDWAEVKGMRSGDNPARWRNYLQRALPPVNADVKHQRALPYKDLPAFMKALRKDDSISARALEVAILTATRSSEVREAVWDEINLVECVWTIPAERMKAKREHRIPICSRVYEILSEMDRLSLKRDDDWVFPGGRVGPPSVKHRNEACD